MNIIVKTWKIFLDALLPLVCINCKRVIRDSANEKDKKIICETCVNEIQINKIFTEIEPEIEPEIILSGAASYGNEALRKLIHSLKYNGLKKSSKPLAEIIIKHMENTGLINSIDDNATIIPIPLHKSKLRERGFNQSELIAKIVGEKLDVPVIDLLKRVKKTSPQIKMQSDMERAENTKNAFKLNPRFTNGRAIELSSYRAKELILVDDVYTSGATAVEAVRILKKLKPKKIIVLVAARADF